MKIERIEPTMVSVPEGVGLCVTVDEDKVAQHHDVYRERGQFLPYQPEMFGAL